MIASFPRTLMLAAVALLALPAGLALAQDPTGGPDDFGYIYADDTAPGGTPADFRDISETGTPLGLAGTDDAAATIELQRPFFIYCRRADTMVVSSNGYLSTDPEDDGTDINRADNLPTATDTTGVRLYPLHGDLILDSATSEVYHQFFEQGPVPNAAGGTEPVTIIQWQDVRLAGGEIGDSVDVQVLLFHESGEVLYQYRDPLGVDGSDVTIGMQNADATSGLLYAADTAGAVTNTRAIRFFPPDEPCPVLLFDGNLYEDGDIIEAGELGLEQPLTMPFTVANYGYGTLILVGDQPQLLNVGDFEVTDTTGYDQTTLEVGETAEFTLNGTVLGANPQATVDISIEGREPFVVVLQGDGVPAEPELLVENPNGEPVPMLEADPDPGLAELPVGVPFTRTYTVRNVGTGTLELAGDAVVTDSSDNVSVLRIGTFSETTLDPRFTANRRESAEFEIEFEVTETGPFLMVVEVPSNDPVNNPYIFRIEGTAVLAPFMVVSPETLDFGTVRTNRTATRTLTIENIGQEQLTISSIEIGGPDADRFTLQSAEPNNIQLPLAQPVLVGPGEMLELTFQFDPQERRDHQAQVTIDSDSAGDSATQTVEMVGTGTQATVDDDDDDGCAALPGGAANWFALVMLALATTLLAWRRRTGTGLAS